MVEEGIANRVVTPLKHTVFPYTEVEAAFRHMAEGVHIGKIVIQVVFIIQNGNMSRWIVGLIKGNVIVKFNMQN